MHKTEFKIFTKNKIVCVCVCVCIWGVLIWDFGQYCYFGESGDSGKSVDLVEFGRYDGFCESGSSG